MKKISYYAIPGVKIVWNSENIIGMVCNLYDISADELMQTLDSREHPYPEIRQLCMTLMRAKTKMSYARIGKVFHKDHATVMHAHKTISNYRQTNKKFKSLTDPLFNL